MNANKAQGLKVKAGLKAGGMRLNHNRSGIRVKAGLKAGIGILRENHSRQVISAR